MDAPSSSLTAESIAFGSMWGRKPQIKKGGKSRAVSSIAVTPLEDPPQSKPSRQESMYADARSQSTTSMSSSDSMSTNYKPQSKPSGFMLFLREEQSKERTISNDVETTDTPVPTTEYRAHSASNPARINPIFGNVFHQIELLHAILSFLEQSDLIAVRSVCKPWDIVASTLLDLPQSRRIDDLLAMLGATKYDQDHPTRGMYTLDFDPYDISPKRLAVFAALLKTIKKIDINFTQKTRSSDMILRIAPEVFMTLSVLCQKICPSQNTLFTGLREVIASQDLFSICPYAFSPMLFPSTVQTLSISNLGCVSVRTVFGYLASVASRIEECSISGDVEVMRKYKSFKASGLEVAINLRSLECKGLTDGWSFLHALSGGCPGLKELRVEFGTFIEEAQPAWRKVTFPTLQSLILLRCHPLQARAMTSFYQSASFVGLNAITMVFTLELGAHTMDRLLLALTSSCKKTLQSLSLSVRGTSSSWNSRHFQTLGSLKNLHTLSIEAIGGKFQVEDDEFRLLCQNLPKLHSLIVNADFTLFTFNSLKLCNPDSNYSLANLIIPINGSTFSHYSSSMVLPPSLLSLGLKIVALEERDLTLFAASIASVCPSSATVAFDGSPTHLICSLKATFLTLHAWRRDSEERTKAELRNARMQMMEMKKMYEQALTERDRAIRRQKSLEVMIGNVFSDESVEEL